MRLNHATAQAAEDTACAFLQKKGFTVLARNWHCVYGEIDIIVRKKHLLVFVEVKYRASAVFGGAAAAITPAKAGKMRRSIYAYLQKYPHRGDIRADAVLIEGGNPPQHLENILDNE